MKKVLVVHGSPRKQGNSHAVVDALCEGFNENVDITTYELSRLDTKGCLACFACKGKAERCVVNDGLSEVLDAVHETDVLVLAAPVYFGDVCSQMKTFIDRLYHLFLPNFHDATPSDGDNAGNVRVSRLREGVKLIFIITQGSIDPALFADINPRYERFFRWLGFDEVYNIRGVGEPARHAGHQMDKAFAQARVLASDVVA